MIPFLFVAITGTTALQAVFQVPLTPAELVGGAASWLNAPLHGFFPGRPVGLGQGNSFGGALTSFWAGAGWGGSRGEGYVRMALHRIPDLPETRLPDPDAPPSTGNQPYAAGTFAVHDLLVEGAMFRGRWGMVVRGLALLSPHVRAYGAGLDGWFRYRRNGLRMVLGVENLVPLVVRFPDAVEYARPTLAAGVLNAFSPRLQVALFSRMFLDGQTEGSTLALGPYGVDVAFLATWKSSPASPLEVLVGAERWNPGVGLRFLWGRLRIAAGYRFHLELGSSFRWSLVYVR